MVRSDGERLLEALCQPEARIRPSALANFAILFCFGGNFRYCIVVAGTPVFSVGVTPVFRLRGACWRLSVDNDTGFVA